MKIRLWPRIDTDLLGDLLAIGGGTVFLCWLSWHIVRLPLMNDYKVLSLVGLAFAAPSIFYESVFGISRLGLYLSVPAMVIGVLINRDLREIFRPNPAPVSGQESSYAWLPPTIMFLVAAPFLLVFWAVQMSITLVISFVVRLMIIAFVIWPIVIMFNLENVNIPYRLVHIFALCLNIIIWVVALAAATEDEDGL